MTIYLKLDMALKKDLNKIIIQKTLIRKILGNITAMNLKTRDNKINKGTQPIVLSGCAI